MHPSDEEKPMADVVVQSIEADDDRQTKVSSTVYDSPKLSLSPSLSDDDLQKPCPAARPPSLGLLTVHPGLSNVDLEKGLPLSAQNTRGSGLSPLYSPCSNFSRQKECSMWPSQQTLKTRKRNDTCNRRGNKCFGLSAKWAAMTRKQRMAIRALLLLIVVGIAVGVAVGITKAVGGTVYGGKSGGKTIN